MILGLVIACVGIRRNFCGLRVLRGISYLILVWFAIWVFGCDFLLQWIC